MMHIPTSVHSGPISTAIVALLAMLFVLPAPRAFAAGRVQPMAHPMPYRATPADAHASHMAHSDPRIAQFNLQLAAYKRTVAALQRDTQRLVAQQRQLDALIQEIGKNAELNMIQLQSVMSQRQTAIQLSTNLLKALNDSANQIVHNMK